MRPAEVLKQMKLLRKKKLPELNKLAKELQMRLSKKEEVELDEEKVPNDDLNWVETGGSFGKKRRFPTYVVKKEGNKYKAYDEQNKMSLKAGANSLEDLAKLLKPYIEKRTGSWKFEEVDLDESKMSSSQIDKLKKAYEPMRGKKISTSNAEKLGKMMDTIGKDKEALIQIVKADIPFVSTVAVNRLISKHNMKGAEINKLKKEEREDWSFRDFVNQIQERELTDTELKRREEIAKDLSDEDFKKRYGGRWKEVKMGVATKMAKKESLKT